MANASVIVQLQTITPSSTPGTVDIPFNAIDTLGNAAGGAMTAVDLSTIAPATLLANIKTAAAAQLNALYGTTQGGSNTVKVLGASLN